MNCLSNKHLAIMAFFIPLTFKAAMLPSLLYQECGADFYIGIGIITVIEFLQLAVILKILSLGGLEGLEEKYGIWAKRLVAVPFLLSMFVKILLFSAEISHYVTQYLFYNISFIPIIGILCITVFYAALKGAKTIGRILELSVWLVPLIIIFGIFFGKANLCGDFLAPLFTDGVTDMVKGLDKYLVYAFDFSPLLFFSVRKGKKISVVVASVLSVIAVVGTYMIFLVSYGRASFLVPEAFARLASFNTVISEIGSLDWPSALLWLAVGVCNISLKFCAIAETGTYFGIKRKPTLFITVTAAGILLITLLNTFRKTVDFVTGPIRYVVIAIEVIVPIIILVMCLAKKQEEFASETQN